MTAFVVDNECIACDTCTAIAPRNFKLTDSNAIAIVYHQPASEQEQKACQEALTCCPVGAISAQ